MPRNRSEHVTTVELPPMPTLEGAPLFVIKLVRIDARHGLGLGESDEGDMFYENLDVDDKLVYDDWDAFRLEQHFLDWKNWYATLEQRINERFDAHATQS